MLDLELRNRPFGVTLSYCRQSTDRSSRQRVSGITQDTYRGDSLLISLKKYLEMEIHKTIHEHRPEGADPAELLPALLESYRSALAAMGQSGAQACPAVGHDLQENLKALESRLAGDLTTPLMKELDGHVTEQLQRWGEQAAAHYKAQAAEVKELLIVLANTAGAVGEHDQSYTKNLNQFTGRLKTISNLDDLTQVRASLLQQAAELRTYVDKMEQESHKLVTQLKTEVSAYETKLKEAEELSLRDPLTGLANRRNVEERLASRVAGGLGFCVIVIDLNRLKKTNDTYGHLAGDNLLQQFAQELRTNFRSTDLVGRWGGDEFIVVMDGDAQGAEAKIARMQKWVFGDYTIRPGKGAGEVKVQVDGAVGLAQWQPGEAIKSLLERADAAMYAQKALSRK
jgi:diguanylate cyclase (GGDEF)-like protein